MKLLHYNIQDGCAGAPARKEAIGRWLQSQHADVVTLNELNGWQAGDGLAEFGRSWGWPHAVIGKVDHSDYPVGILSRRPIDGSQLTGRPFHHALLQASIGGLQVWVTHLSPMDARQRVVECRWIADRARAVTGPLILAGDLNTLTPIDAPMHARLDIQASLQANTTLKRKFLTPRGAIDYEPMQILLAGGLVDICAPDQPQASVPTPFNRDAAHAAPMRLDYLLANAALMQAMPRGWVERGEAVRMLSDHYPVVGQWGPSQAL
jgi:endonuclease/exonuclease/phosphatase family metal-dependent hydrolase